MKKSHRKDVIIARIIFAAMCIVLVAIIISVAVLVHNRNAEKREQQSTEQTDNNLPPESENPLLPPVTENPSEEETMTNGTVWTITGVNMRQAPNTDGEVVMVLDPATELELLGEEEGWVMVRYHGQEGYVCADYITDEAPQE